MVEDGCCCSCWWNGASGDAGTTKADPDTADAPEPVERGEEGTRYGTRNRSPTAIPPPPPPCPGDADPVALPGDSKGRGARPNGPVGAPIPSPALRLVATPPRPDVWPLKASRPKGSRPKGPPLAELPVLLVAEATEEGAEGRPREKAALLGRPGDGTSTVTSELTTTTRVPGAGAPPTLEDKEEEEGTVVPGTVADRWRCTYPALNIASWSCSDTQGYRGEVCSELGGGFGGSRCPCPSRCVRRATLGIFVKCAWMDGGAYMCMSGSMSAHIVYM